MRVYSFPKGGLQYEDPYAPVKGPSVSAFLPSVSVVPLGNNSGSRAYPLVYTGEHVREGMIIGRGSGPRAANVHATVPGKVIRMVTWKDSDGFTNDGIAILMEGAFEKLGKKEEIFPWKGIQSHDLLRIIGEYGIVEMENRGRPLQDMISYFKKTYDRLSLVVRCVFDDPWLAADYALCRERVGAVVEGSVIAARASSTVDRIIFAVSHKERELGDMLLAEAGQYDIPSSVVLVGSRYPQRNRRELTLALRKYEKAQSLNLGTFMIIGPATLAAVYDAVKFKKPVLERYVAVGGSAVRHPQVMKVRIGTRIGDLFEQCGGFIERPARVAAGSPLLGKQVLNLDEPVSKSCYAVFALLKSNAVNQAAQSCINCGECRAVCPLGLDPEDLYKKIIVPGLKRETYSGCHGCGCCKVVCPSALPLSEYILRETIGGTRG
jgi:electron transport complex protein RnfC